MESPTKVSKHEIRSCLKKVKYLRDAAKKEARSMRRKFHHKNLKPYKCQFCGYWHVGHTNQ